jgi:2-polyprenyl-3-methyl-5-hydroxy-6-metoxy-1,4-benzoquinol methylase
MLDKYNYLDYLGYSQWMKDLNLWGDFCTITNLYSQELDLQFRKSDINLKNLRVLEVGFGSGKILKYCLNRGCNVEGIEIQENLLQAASENNIKAYKNIQEIDGEGYDLIIGFDVLEHMDTAQLLGFFKKASSLLNKGGKMIYRYPNGDSYAGLPSFNGDFTHKSMIGFMKIKQLSELNGLMIESYRGAVDFPVRKISNLVKKIMRWPFKYIIGFGSPIFFSGTIVAVIKHKEF